MATAEKDLKAEGTGNGAPSAPRWNLADLYPGAQSPEFAADLAKSRESAKAFAADYAGRLAAMLAGPSPSQALAEAVMRYEALQDLGGRLMSYASLLHAGDNSDPKIAKFYGDTIEAITAVSTDLLFFELELNRLDDAALNAAMASAPLDHYAPWLEDIRRDKPHQLDDTIERLFMEKSTTGASAWNRLFDETIAAMRFTVDGETMALEPLLSLFQDRREERRRAAALALGETLGEKLPLFTLVTNTLAKDKEISDRWRHFADCADSRHLANRVERETVEALAAAVRERHPRLSHRYYALKAKWFGKAKLDHWDRNAPLPEAPQSAFTWDQARETVLSAYAGFSPEMRTIAERFFTDGWIDGQSRPGKSPGAFAHPVTPSAHPYVLLNYLGRPRDVMTMAHELGHGVHQVLAAGQGALMAATPLTIAETASVFGEMLTFRALLKATRSPAERKAMLASKVEDMLNTVVRQIAFYEFERKIHLERKKGELTAEAICGHWMDVQRDSLGPSIVLRKGYENYWAYIGHFVHSPFYVYAYAFGDCLVNSLYGLYESAEPGFVERYFALLRAGGSKPYGELLKPFGLDARDPGFWRLGLSLIERMIDELETMT